MPTAKKRINISVPRAVARAIVKLADRDEVPAATKAAELLRYSLEIEEDDVLNALASGRDGKGARYVTHRRAWA